MTSRLLIGAALFQLFATSSIEAALVTLPSGLNPGDQYRLVFVTSGTTDATSSDIATYNSFVSNAANAVPALANLGVGWSAIVSTDAVDARTNTNTDPTPAGDTGVPIFDFIGFKIADQYDDLWDGSLDSDGIFYSEIETFVGFEHVWTGTDVDGLGVNSATLGNVSEAAVNGISAGRLYPWINRGLDHTSDLNYLYGISDVITISVPEPSTATLLLGMGLLASGWRRRIS